MRGVTEQRVAEALKSLFGDLESSLPPRISKALLKEVYHNRIFECHPDRANSLGNDESQLVDKTSSLNGAYALLSKLVKTQDLETAKFRAVARRKKRAMPKQNHRAPRRTVKQTVSRKPSQGTSSRPEEYDYRGVMADYWDGELPSRQLRFGRYLYYKGLISWDSLVEALMWQAEQKPLLGEVLVGRGDIGRSELQQVLLAKANGEFFGDCAMRLGLANSKQIRAALDLQDKKQRPVGTYFLKRGLLQYDSLQRHLKKHQEHNQRFVPSMSAAAVRTNKTAVPKLRLVKPL